jgi:DNA-directed RNA polymerase subunit D
MAVEPATTNVFQNYAESGLTAQWTLTPSNYAYANTLRRLIMGRVPVVGFRAEMTDAGTTTDVEILANTTPMTNEMLAHRIGLLPLHVQDPDDWAKEGNGDSYEFVCNVTHNAPQARDVTTNDIEVFRVSKDGERTPVDAAKFFKPFGYAGHTGHILLATLKAQLKGSQGKPEALAFKAKASVGYGTEHARFIPTSRATYSYTPDPDPARLEEVFYDWAARHKKLERGALEADSGKKDKLMKEFNTMEVQRCYLKGEDGEPYSFDFVVESVGVYSPKKIVDYALKAGERMCESYLTKEGGALPANVQVLPADAEIYAFDFIFDGEDHTLGHLLQTWIDINLYGRGVVNYVGYDPMHPLAGKLYLRIGVVDNSEETARGVLQEALTGCAALFRSWRGYWTAASGGVAVDEGIQGMTQKKTVRRLLSRPPPAPAPNPSV